jgi:hypothetical protein
MITVVGIAKLVKEFFSVRNPGGTGNHSNKSTEDAHGGEKNRMKSLKKCRIGRLVIA